MAPMITKLLGTFIAQGTTFIAAMPVGDPSAAFIRDVLSENRFLCAPHSLPGTVVGYDFAGNPVNDVECRGICPAMPYPDADDDEQCTWGCAPADYTACSAGNCFEGGEAECIAHADHSGDHVCAWADGECTGCTSVTESSCRAGDHPNCEWNSANGGTCVAKGPTSTPICDSRNNHCPGYENQNCSSSGDDASSVRECSITGYRRLWTWRHRPVSTTAAPVVFTPAPNPDFDRILEREEILPGHRNRRHAASRDTYDRIYALGKQMLGHHIPADQSYSADMKQLPVTSSKTWITGYSCDVDSGSCTVSLGQHTASNDSSEHLGVTVEYCGELYRQIKRQGISNWLEATDGQGSGCMPFWISQQLLSRVYVVSQCDCVQLPSVV